MDPTQLIERDLAKNPLQQPPNILARPTWIRLHERYSHFPSFGIYMVSGDSGRFDFPILPNGSCGFYAANGTQAIRLSRKHREVEEVLKRDWQALPEFPVVELAEFILGFYDDGIRESHRVLANKSDLERMCGPHDYRLDQYQYSAIEDQIGQSQSSVVADKFCIRAVTLRGLMHDKRNLGIEEISVSRNGSVAFASRNVLSDRIFQFVPGIIY